MKLKYRPAVFLVVYRKDGKKIRYLILHRILHWQGWEFPKGGINGNESEENAVYRELCEETGLGSNKILEFNLNGKYKYKTELKDRKGFIGQTWKLFACEVKSKQIKIDKKEHDGYQWLGFKDAYKILTWANQKKCLKKVDRFLNS